MGRLGLALALFTAVMALGAGSASAALRVVDNTPAATCKSGLGPFTTIQAAVDASAANDSIVVCSGTYVEQVRITVPGLKLQANVNHTARIQAPTGLTDQDALVDIDGANNVRIMKMVITGPTNEEIGSGVLVHGNATGAQIRGNRILNIRTEAPGNGDRTGNGIQFGVFGAISPGRGLAQDNEISNYQGTGIVAVNGAVVNINRNRITGLGPTDSIGQAGIYIFPGVRATISGNAVSENRGPDPDVGVGGVGIFLSADGARLSSNLLTGNDFGITVGDSRNSIFTGNLVAGGQFGIINGEFSTGNRYIRNRALDNSSVDCLDRSNGSGTGGTANRWISNVGAIASPDPICD